MSQPISTVVYLDGVSPIHLSVDEREDTYVVVVGVERGQDNVLRTTQLRFGFIQEFAPSGALLGKWGTAGTGPGQFREPRGIAVDRDGNMYVVDALNRRVQQLSAFGTPLAQHEVPGAGFGRPSQPWAVALGPRGTLYVTDRALHCIHVLGANGAQPTRWGGPGGGA